MQIICPACGLRAEVEDDRDDSTHICLGCGKQFYLESTEAEPSTPPPPEEEAGLWELGAAASSTPVTPTPRRAKSTEKHTNRNVIIAAVCLVVGAMLAVLITVITNSNSSTESPVGVNTAPSPQTTPPSTSQWDQASNRPADQPSDQPWDKAHRQQLLQLNAQADTLAIEGKWQQSYEAYKRVTDLAVDHEISDPVVKEILASSRNGQDRALNALMILSTRAGKTPAEAHGPPSAVPPASVTAPSQPTSQNVQAPPNQATPDQPSADQASADQARPDDSDPTRSAADHAPPLAGPKPPTPALRSYTLPDAVTDKQIGAAIDNGVRFLASQFRNGEVVSGAPDAPITRGPDGSAGAKRPVPPPSFDGLGPDNSGLTPLPPVEKPLPGRTPRDFVAPWTTVYSEPGIDALCVYALLNAGRAQDTPGLGEKDPFSEQILDRLKGYEMPFTYHRSLRAAALGVFARTKDVAALEEDVRWLQAATTRGGYTYGMPADNSGRVFDNSNSQYGLLGVWSGAQAGIDVSGEYWREVESHWKECASEQGTWGYGGVQSGYRLTMTCAGLASLLVAGDYIEAQQPPGSDIHPGDPAALQSVNRGLNFLDTGDNCMTGLGQGGLGGTGYALYGLERVGLASGFKYFGTHDWYAELAKQIVAEQHLDGSWSGGGAAGVQQGQVLIDTAYALLFLSRGRHPILFNKLRFDGNWNNRPHDAQHLARFAARQLERPLNWQVVNFRRNWWDWMDCPVLYITSDKRLDLKPADYKALADFANGGGLIFTHADGGSPEFNAWVNELVRKIFPRYELMQVRADHPIYSTVYRLTNPPPLLTVSNGSRVLLVHSPTDIANGWQLNWTTQNKAAFQLGVNLFVYAAGKGNFKNRIASSYIPPDPNPSETIRHVARLQYASEWDPEPYAWTRFSRYFQWETHKVIEPVTVQLKDLQPGFLPLAVLTGTVRHDFTQSEVDAARAYVHEGGVLMIDACGGQSAFAKSVETTLITPAFAGATLAPISNDHPLLVASRLTANDLSHPMFRAFATENGGRNLPILTLRYGKGWVIFSRLDLTTGLLGTQSWGILGFDPAYAQALMKNAVLWTQARSPVPENAPATNRSNLP